MAFDLALFDLVSSYALLGDSFGQWHAALSVLFVDEHSIAIDETGVVISGVARFSGDVHPYIDPSNMTFGVQAENTEGHPANDPGRRDPWFDIRDAHIDFQLTAPRVASQKALTAASAIGGAASFASSAAVLNAYDPVPVASAPSDFPDTEFTLDMLLTVVVLRPPFLRPAKLLPNGQLVEDTTKSDVKFNLPRIKIRMAQGSGNTDPLTVDLLSLGADSLDDPDDLGVAELVTMDPPYAFIGSAKTVGFGFRSATLDLSSDSTPPDVLAQFGFDENWTGLYLPEIRLFIAPNGANGFAVDAGARNLLIGFGASAGVTGDFDLEVIDQGSGKLQLGARFYDNAGQSYAITRVDDTHATVSLPATTRMIVDVNGGLTPYNASAQFDSDAATPGRVFDCDLTTRLTRTILISVTDSRPTPNTQTLTIVANRLAASLPATPGTTSAPGSPPAQIETLSVTQDGHPVGTPRLALNGETPTTASVKLAADPPVAAHWTIDGVDSGTSLTVQVSLPPGGSVHIQAEVPGAPATDHFEAFYRFDYPSVKTADGRLATDDDTRAYALIVDNPPVLRSTNTVPAVDDGLTAPWPGGTDAASAIAPLLANLPPNTQINIKGFASFETPGADKLVYNTALARRRAIGLEAIIGKVISDASLGSKNFIVNPGVADMSHWNATEQGGDVQHRHLFWKALATWPAQAMPGTVTQGRVWRDALTPVTPPPLPDNPTTAATPPQPPSWFKEMGAKVRIVQNHFVACEVFGKFDIQTPAEQQLQQGGVANADMPALRRLGSNPSDGIIDVRVIVQIDDATDTVTVSGYFGADPADRDGLMMTGALANEPPADRNLGRNYLGMAIAFMPLLSAAAGAVAGDGALAEIAVTSAVLAVPFTLGSLPWITVERVIWYGGELTVQVRPDGTQVVALFDFETAISANISLGSTSLITIPRNAPLVVRYKAIGLLLGNPPGQPKFQARPMFDASKGYTIDVSRPGAIQVAAPLGQILKILGARISRNNPLLFEIDLGFAIDLGVVTIERARVRLRMNPPGLPELTAFAASIDIPGAVKGRGYLEMNPGEIKGQIDLTIVPVQVRIAAGIGIAHIDPDETGVIITLSVEFPVAIPLASSGIGIYGFLGLFAMNYARNESSVPASNMAPALAWLKATGGDPTNIAFWSPKLNSWAFGVGAILGTMGSSVIFNLKGVLLLELPGPRLLLMMKANLLAVIPELQGTAEGTFLAVLDLDFGRGTLTIGLSIDFNVDPLLRISIPVEAFFDFNDTSNWHLFLGQYVNQVQAKVLQVFDASGYLMLSGSGLPLAGQPNLGDLPAVTGFSIATGLHVSFKWGGGPLYAELAAGFDAIIGFSPFRMAGTLTVRGTLHLFILDISAWADLHVDIGEDAAHNKISKISGDICGKVDFLFFSISGCVSFSLGADAVPAAPLPNLLKSLKLISRSPALVLGTGVDKPIDGGIGDGVEGDAQPGTLPVVPIDAIPTLLMNMPPLSVPGLAFLGQAVGGTPEAPSDGWNQRGDTWYKYTVKSVELLLHGAAGGVTAGKTPATWWKPKTGSTAVEAQLALLSWVPEATPKAIGSSKYLDEMVKEHWGTVCQPAAPAAPIFWTFLNSLLGVSSTGWRLDGIPLPDPPGAIRSAPPNTRLRVYERWRSGNAAADMARGIVAAQVEGSSVACPDTPPVLQGNPIPLGRAPGSFAGINPLTAIRGGTALENTSVAPLTLTDALNRFATGQPVGRASLAGLALAGSPNGAAAGQGGCFARVLAAPILDNGQPVAFGNPTRKDIVVNGWNNTRFKPGPLDDAVVFETGAFEYARFYLWVPLRLLTNTLVVAASDANDNLFNQHIITAADTLPPRVFPSAWNDPASVWHRSVLLVSEMAAGRKDYVGVFVEIKGGGAADRVQIGALPNSRDIRRVITLRPFYVAAVEALRRSEVTRSDYDTTEQTNKQGVLASALGLDSADNALLQPDQPYQVRVTWNAQSAKPDPGQHPADGTPGGDVTQSFWFQTDSQPPARLDPWILAGLPAEGEKQVFASDPVRVVFATNNLALLFDAYGKQLRARLRPASFRPVIPPPGVAHPFPLDATTLIPVKAAVLSPWEEAVQNALEGTCVAVSGDRIRHSMVTIPIPLDLYTDYILDIEMLDKGAADDAVGTRIWRETFTTGGFHTLEEFAGIFQIARVGHRGVHSADTGKLQAVGTAFAAHAPLGHEFDTALQNAGLDALPVPKSPQAIVFWEPAAPLPQPVAILLDASEPMQRLRPLPTEVADGGLAAAKRFEMQPTLWLDLAQQAGGDDIVDHIVVAPGGQRALITLKAGARDKNLRMALRRIAQPAPYLDGPTATDQFVTVLDLQLKNAPWEEVD